MVASRLYAPMGDNFHIPPKTENTLCHEISENDATFLIIDTSMDGFQSYAQGSLCLYDTAKRVQYS